ncbi:unnamed protein product [Arctogadus glacialis]
MYMRSLMDKSIQLFAVRTFANEHTTTSTPTLGTSRETIPRVYLILKTQIQILALDFSPLLCSNSVDETHEPDEDLSLIHNSGALDPSVSNLWGPGPQC